MSYALEHHESAVIIGERNITNLRFDDDIDGLADSENELVSLVDKLHNSSISFGMQLEHKKQR